MELLKAVNTVLPHLGEHVVTRIEGARHPTVDLIVSAIERKQLSVLSEGWWFNEMTIKLQVNTDGQIDAPHDVIAIYGLDCNVELDGTKLMNLETGSRYFDKAVKVKIVRNVEFDRLPINIALYITYNACQEVYLQDFGYEQSLPVLQQNTQIYWVLSKQENLRKRKYNSQINTRRSFSGAVRFR